MSLRDDGSGLRMVLLDHHESSGATDTEVGYENEQLNAKKTSIFLSCLGDVRLAHEFQLLPLVDVDAEPVCRQGLRRTLTHHAQAHESLCADGSGLAESEHTHLSLARSYCRTAHAGWVPAHAGCRSYGCSSAWGSPSASVHPNN